MRLIVHGGNDELLHLDCFDGAFDLAPARTKLQLVKYPGDRATLVE